jgi:hypothetical protein
VWPALLVPWELLFDSQGSRGLGSEGNLANPCPTAVRCIDLEEPCYHVHHSVHPLSSRSTLGSPAVSASSKHTKDPAAPTMSGIEVVAAVSAIISAFHGGSELLKHIKEKRRKVRQARQLQQEFEEKQLEDSLVSGKQQIGFRWEQDLRQFGDLIRVGDGKLHLCPKSVAQN